MAESGGNFATTLGKGMATLYLNRRTGTEEGAVFLERNAGFPVEIIDGGRYFVALDVEGCVNWHDNQTGKLLAVFRLYPNFWVLEKTVPPGPRKETLRGGLNNASASTP